MKRPKHRLNPTFRTYYLIVSWAVFIALAIVGAVHAWSSRYYHPYK